MILMGEIQKVGGGWRKENEGRLWEGDGSDACRGCVSEKKKKKRKRKRRKAGRKKGVGGGGRRGPKQAKSIEKAKRKNRWYGQGRKK